MVSQGYKRVPIQEAKAVASDVTDFIEYLRAIREQSGISQEKLAEGTNCAAAYIRAIEAGRRIPSLPMLIRILKTLGHKIVLKPV
jgi:transcriptional regulator with XRE-family HTH domain